MNIKATQTGVSEEEEKEKEVETQIDTSSLNFMEQIERENYRKEQQEEIDAAKAEGREPAPWALENEDEDEETDEESEETKKEEENETGDSKTKEDEGTDTNKSDTSGSKTEDESSSDSTDSDPLVEIIVDGKKEKVPMSKILDAGKRTLQKESAADRRLEEATQLLKDAKAATSKKEDKKETTDVTDEEIKQLRFNYIKKVQYGEPEEAAEALEKWEKAVLGRTSKASSTTREDVDLRTELKKIRLEERVLALPEEGGYKDLLENPILRKHVESLVDSIVERNEGTYDSYDTYKTAGDAIRKIATTLDPKYVPPKIKSAQNVDSFEGKKDRKKKIVNLPASSEKAMKKTDENSDKEESVSDVIADMRKQRGQ